MTTQPSITYAYDAVSITISHERADYNHYPEDRDRHYWQLELRIGSELVHLDYTLSTYLYRPLEALKSAVGFLGAWAEAIEYEERTGKQASENGDLFPREVWDQMDWQEWTDQAMADLEGEQNNG